MATEATASQSVGGSPRVSGRPSTSRTRSGVTGTRPVMPSATQCAAVSTRSAAISTPPQAPTGMPPAAGGALKVSRYAMK